MIERDLVGRKLIFPGNIYNYNVGGPPVPKAGHPGFVTQQVRRLRHQAGTGRELAFQWLCWIPGKVNQVPLFAHHLDVLSGPFSGCWMVIYRINGTLYVGHIGTEENPNSPNSTTVKNAWRTFVHLNPAAAANFAGFKPSFHNPTGLAGEIRTLGLVTQQRRCYSVSAVIGHDAGGRVYYHVVSVDHAAVTTGLLNIFPP